jgi:hypothetical protein
MEYYHSVVWGRHHSSNVEEMQKNVYCVEKSVRHSRGVLPNPVDMTQSSSSSKKKGTATKTSHIKVGRVLTDIT